MKNIVAELRDAVKEGPDAVCPDMLTSAADEIERLRPAHADYILVVSKPDEGGRVTVRSPDFPTLEVCGDTSEVFDWVTDEIEKMRERCEHGNERGKCTWGTCSFTPTTCPIHGPYTGARCPKATHSSDEPNGQS